MEVVGLCVPSLIPGGGLGCQGLIPNKRLDCRLNLFYRFRESPYPKIVMPGPKIDTFFEKDQSEGDTRIEGRSQAREVTQPQW